MKNIVKEFPGVRALDGVSFTLEAGEFHALVGENGAGKSTLMKVLSGVYPAGQYSGEILIGGKTMEFSGIRDSEKAGVAIIFQELSLVKELTVGENIFLAANLRPSALSTTQSFTTARQIFCATSSSTSIRVNLSAIWALGDSSWSK